jgi:hypothetical protein
LARLDIRTFIRATPDRVWSVIKDLEAQRQWMVDVHELELKSEQREGIGAVVEVRSELFGFPLIHDVMEITSWEPPREMNVLHRGQFSGTGSFQLQAVPGGTVFTWIEDFEPPLGPLGELAFETIVKPHLKRVFGRSMDNVRRLAEAPEAETPPAAT